MKVSCRRGRDAVPGQVPGDDVDVVAQQGAGLAPQQGGCSERGPDDEEGLVAERALGREQDCFDGGSSHGKLRSGCGGRWRRRGGGVFRVGREDAAGDLGGLAEVVGRVQKLLKPGVGEQLRPGRPRGAVPVGGRLLRGRGLERLVHDGLQPLLPGPAPAGAVPVQRSGPSRSGATAAVTASESSSGPARSRLRRMAAGEDLPALRPVRAAAPAAPRARRSSWRRAGHSLCQAPSGRSSLKLAAARCSCAARAGACRAALRISTDSTGFCFCGMAEDTPRPAARGSASSATSGRLRNRTSAAILPAASVTAARASPSEVTASRLVCQGAGTVARPSGRPAGRRGQTGSARGRPAPDRSARCRRPGSRRRRRSAPAVRGPRAGVPRRPARGTTARPAARSVNGSECWVRLRPTHSVSACCSGEAGERRRRRLELGEQFARRRPAASSIRAESSTSWLVSEVCTALHRRRVRRCPGP